jgi:hypothetical protein
LLLLNNTKWKQFNFTRLFMATPVFQFQHPDLPGENLYFIQNTYSDLPETIPMDLTTFLIYHDKIGRTVSGLLICWEDLNKTGSSLYDNTFDDYFSKEEKLMIHNLAIDSGAIRFAKENILFSEKIKFFIDEKLYESQSLSSFIEAIAKAAIDNFRQLNYYKSLHDLFLFKEKLGNINLPSTSDEDADLQF